MLACWGSSVACAGRRIIQQHLREGTLLQHYTAVRGLPASWVPCGPTSACKAEVCCLAFPTSSV